MTTPIPFLLLALDGRIDFVRLTSPFAGASSPASQTDPAASTAGTDDPPPGVVRTKIRALMQSFRQ
jgi:hypothetical protein